MENGNGKLEVGVGDKRIAVTSRDLISVLLIAVAGLGGYFVASQITNNQQHGLNALAAMVEKMASHQAVLVELVHTNRQQMEAELKSQNALLQQQTTMLTGKVDEQSHDLETKFEKVYRELNMLNYNLHRDISEQLPLNGTPPPR